MAVVVNTNVDSIKIQNNLTSATNALSTSMERMSSGLKVISAKDDAAGTVISARMQVQLDGNEIAQNNVQNGDALLATAEGYLDTIEENLSRIRDLTLQAKNGTYSTEEIAAMQDEVAERIAEIDRISEVSTYSQLDLFEDETLQKEGITFQVGANSSSHNTILADASIFQSVKFSAMTGYDDAYTLSSDYTEDEAAGIEVVTDEDAGTTETRYYYATVTETEDEDGNITASVEYTYTTDADYELADGQYWLNQDGVDAFTAIDDETEADEDADYSSLVSYGSTFDLTTMSKDDMSKALDALDTGLDNVTGRKSLIGSAQNRLESALETLTTQYENLSSANSIITDADIASEASEYTQQSILQQISTALLATANQAPSIALSLVAS